MIDPRSSTQLRPGQVPFERAEYEGRWHDLRTRMVEADLDAVLVTDPDNVFYLTGYQTFGNAQQFLVIGPDRASEPIFVLRQLECMLVEYTTWVEQVRAYQDHEDPARVVAEVVSSLVGSGARLGVEEQSPSLPALLLDQIIQASGLRTGPASDVIHAGRMVKSPAEVALCRQAAEFTDAGIRAALDAIGEDRDENAVAAAASAAMIAAGSEWFGEQPIVTSGERAGVPHTTYARRPLRRGDCVLIEMSGVFHRHFAPMMRTAFIGEPPSHVLDMYAACRAGLEAAMAVIRPGITSSEAHEACEKAIAEFGYGDWFKKRLGYSVGTGLGFWNEGHIIDLKPDDESALQAGMLFHLPPALRDPFRHGVGVSETVLITPEGCEQLGKVPRELHVAPARRPAS
jgi:Xaa-Pro dipeptidase